MRCPCESHLEIHDNRCVKLRAVECGAVLVPNFARLCRLQHQFQVVRGCIPHNGQYLNRWTNYFHIEVQHQCKFNFGTCCDDFSDYVSQNPELLEIVLMKINLIRCTLLNNLPLNYELHIQWWSKHNKEALNKAVMTPIACNKGSVNKEAHEVKKRQSQAAQAESFIQQRH